MINPRHSIYRDALQVSPERIAAMGEEDLKELMRQLLKAQAYKCGSPPDELRVSNEVKAKDDGSDGWSASPAVPDKWLGSVATCWQFKAGSAGEPSRLIGEVTKPIPRETLAAGGRFIVVASGSTNGKKGEQDRLKKLITEAEDSGIPTIAIDVFGSERLTNWCNQHPAIAAYWAGRPEGLWTLDDWSRSDEHQVPWQASARVQSKIEDRRADLDFATDAVYHLHIQGPPGVGKTRFALELCREAAWRHSVIYIRQATDIRLIELIDGAVADPGVQLTVVADEVQAEQLRPLRDSVGRSNGRIRLITVGHSVTPDPRRIPALTIDPLESQEMAAVIRGWYPEMPPEHVDFIVRFADGYVRLASLAADAVAQDPTMNIRRLLSRDEIRGFLDQMLGHGDRCALYVVAVLTSVGWTDDRQGEGKAIARHFDLEWNRVCETVEDFHRRLGIAPRGGRYRYISPVPLGIHLAVEAWTVHPDLLKSLPGVLPSDGAKDAYYERLQSIASNPQARKFARAELAFFFRIDDFIDARAVRRWSALSSADPAEAASNILRALTGTSVEDRNRIGGNSRREIVWTLVSLSWKPSSFYDAVKSLALLAEAENESWGNNATEEFVARFQVVLGGTAVPYLERLSVLDDLLAENRPALASLTVKALSQVGNEQPIRMGSSPASDELPEREWQPSTWEEYLECLKAAIERLSKIARLGIPEIQADLVVAAQHLSMMLEKPTARGLVASFFNEVRDSYPEARELLRRSIADIVYRDKKYWKNLSVEDLNEIEALHARFEESSLSARLRQYVGQESWDPEEQSDLRPLAEELCAAPELLVENWSWLTSGEAAAAWRLGEALATVDSEGKLGDIMPSLPGGGHDLRLLCGYVRVRRQHLGDDWYDGWVTSQLEHNPKSVALLFEIAWRCGATVSIAKRVAETLRSEEVSSHIVRQLEFGRFSLDLPVDVLEIVLRTMTDTGHLETAIGILESRLRTNPGEVGTWESLALQLVTSSKLIRSRHMTSYSWKKVASTIVPNHAGEIAAAIFREQADRESDTWFAEFSDAETIIHECTEHDPKGVWRAMQSYLSSPADRLRFSIGFPRGVLERVPADEIGSWIAEKPDERCAIVARLASKDLSKDETLVSRLLGEYGDKGEVASAFFSAYVSGSWSGPASAHWDQLAESLEVVASRTSLPKLRRWATDSARSLRLMAERDRQREEEEGLGRR